MNRLWTRSLQLDRPTYAPTSCFMAFTPQCSLAITYYFFNGKYYQILIAAQLLTQGYYLTVVLVGLKPTTSESLVQDVTNLFTCLYEVNSQEIIQMCRNAMH